MIKITIVFLIVIFCFCEFFIYYIVIFQCKWPPLNSNKNNEASLRAMILADTHLLGPYKGHWFDKLRREWQMNRAFQTTMTIFQPKLVFVLGDLFDEGYMVDNEHFNNYVIRFHKLFHIPKTTKIISVVGNHDVGFHYRMHPFFTNRFEANFNNTGISLYSEENIHFVTINSMAMENDYCYFCENAEAELDKISKTLKCYKNITLCKVKLNKKYEYSRPIMMQHFPTYRESDASCFEQNADKIELFREKWEVLSKDATVTLGKKLNPRVAFSGHSHDYCRSKNLLNIEEYTTASFSWRYKNQPSFLLASFTTDDHAVSNCKIPQESTVLTIYFFSVILSLIFNICYIVIQKRKIPKKVALS